jgi:hypothetical protein
MVHLSKRSQGRLIAYRLWWGDLRKDGRLIVWMGHSESRDNSVLLELWFAKKQQSVI